MTRKKNRKKPANPVPSFDDLADGKPHHWRVTWPGPNGERQTLMEWDGKMERVTGPGIDPEKVQAFMGSMQQKEPEASRTAQLIQELADHRIGLLDQQEVMTVILGAASSLSSLAGPFAEIVRIAHQSLDGIDEELATVNRILSPFQEEPNAETGN